MTCALEHEHEIMAVIWWLGWLQDEYGAVIGGLPAAGSKPGGYVPPSLKNRGAGGEGETMRRREENSLRVTNLSEDTREDDLRVRGLSCSIGMTLHDQPRERD